MPEDRIDRKYHPDGSLAEEIPYRGTLEHGTWRQWHPNGQLAGEWFLNLGAYMNGTNRTWYPDGRLQSEHTYVNGVCTALRIYTETGKVLFDSATTHRDLIRKFAARARRAKPRRVPARPKRSPDDELIDGFLNAPTVEALPWLRDQSSERTLGEFDPAASVQLVSTLHDLGSPSILAAEIQNMPGGPEQTSGHLIISLPQDPAARARLFTFVSAYARNQGFDPVRDTGQDRLWLKLC